MASMVNLSSIPSASLSTRLFSLLLSFLPLITLADIVREGWDNLLSIPLARSTTLVIAEIASDVFVQEHRVELVSVSAHSHCEASIDPLLQNFKNFLGVVHIVVELL